MDLSSIPVIDHHAAPILDADAIALSLAAAFAPSDPADATLHHLQHTLSYRRSLRDIAALFQCDATEAAIQHHRASLGVDAIAQHCLRAAHLDAVFLDHGMVPDTAQPWEWHHQTAPSARLIQLEHLAEQLIPNVDRFDVFLEWFRSEIDPLPDQSVGFKSTAACRTGLDIQLVYYEMAEESFLRLKQHQQASPDSALRLDKALIDFLLLEALEVAKKYTIPVQFHTGFGRPSLDLRLANPLYLRPIFEELRYASVPIVLLNGAYPFTREAGYLASQYANAYVDFGLAIPCLSIPGMRLVIEHLLELAPMTKILYSSGARFIPEQFYLGATWARKILGHVLDAAIQNGDLTASEAEEGAIAILHRNARTLYLNKEAQSPPEELL